MITIFSILTIFSGYFLGVYCLNNYFCNKYTVNRPQFSRFSVQGKELQSAMAMRRAESGGRAFPKANKISLHPV